MAAFGSAYNQTVSASGGAPPHTFSFSSGALPPGLSLEAATGTITGVATTSGLFSFTITATDANDCTGVLAYTLAIAPGGITAIPTLSGWG